MSFANAVAGGLGAFIQTRLMKKDKERRDKMDSLVERLADLNSGVKKSEVTYGMPNATEVDSNGMTTRDFAGGKTTTFGDKPKKPDVVTGDNATALEKKNELFGFKKLSDGSYMQDSDGGKTIQFLAHGGTVGYYHGGMGGCPDRMSWQKDNFKK